MFGGKTTRLLTVIERDMIRGLKVACFKPLIDIRYSQQKITSHLGATVNATVIRDGEDILRFVRANTCDSVAVDELFMVPNSGKALVEVFRMGINVYVSTLQLSSIPESYVEVDAILPWATEVKVCPAVCVQCGADAYYTYKKGGDPNAAVEIGGANLYEPRCFQHFFS